MTLFIYKTPWKIQPNINLMKFNYLNNIIEKQKYLSKLIVLNLKII